MNRARLLLAVTLSKAPNLHFVGTTLEASCTGKCFELQRGEERTEVAQFSLSDIDERCSRDRLSGVAIVEIFHPPRANHQRCAREREKGREGEKKSEKAGTGEEKKEESTRALDLLERRSTSRTARCSFSHRYADLSVKRRKFERLREPPRPRF